MNQFVTATVKTVSPGKRVKAFLLDYLVIAAYTIILALVTFGLAKETDNQLLTLEPIKTPALADGMAFATLVLPVILYFTLLESSDRQASWGKTIVGIRVATAAGNQVSRTQAFIRSAFKFLPWQIAHTAMFHIEGWPLAPLAPTPLVLTAFILVWLLVALTVVSIFLTSGRRSHYDWIAGTEVVGTVGGGRGARQSIK